MEPKKRPPRHSRKRLWWAFCLVALPVLLYVLMRRATALRPREISLRSDVRIVRNLAYSPDGKFLGFETNDREPKPLSWVDTQSGQPLDVKSAGYADLNAARLQHAPPQSPRVAVSSEDVIEARDAKTHRLLWATTPHLGVYKPHIHSVEFVGTGKHLVAQDDDGRSWLLEAHDGNVIYYWYSGYDSEAYGALQLKSVSSEQVSEVIVYSFHDLYVNPHSYNESGKYRVELYDPRVKKMLGAFNFPLPQKSKLRPIVNDSVLSPDGKTLGNIVLLHDFTHVIEMHAYLWHFQQHKPQMLEGDFAPPQSKNAKKPNIPEYTDIVESSLVFSPDGRYLAAACKIGTDTITRQMVCVWDATARRLLHTWHGTSGKVVFSQDSQLLANASESKVNVWDVRTGCNIRSVSFKKTDEADFALAPDGQTLATAEPNHHLVKLWPLAR